MKESRLYSFLNNELGFNLHVLDGTKLMEELKVIHNIGPTALPFYKDTVLSSMHMITFLKPGESLGVYIDSENPFFRFKIEMSYSGQMRTLLLPEEFESFPNRISGIGRVSKIYNSKEPYTSVIELLEDSTDKIVNNILKDSYQTNSKVILNETSNHAIMITKLPRKEIKKVIEDESLNISIEEYRTQHKELIESIFSQEQIEIEDFVPQVEKWDLVYLHSKEVKFSCPCSLERMTQNLMTLNKNDRKDVFAGKDSVEVRCDYCNTIYDVKEVTLQ